MRKPDQRSQAVGPSVAWRCMRPPTRARGDHQLVRRPTCGSLLRALSTGTVGPFQWTVPGLCRHHAYSACKYDADRFVRVGFLRGLERRVAPGRGGLVRFFVCAIQNAGSTGVGPTRARGVRGCRDPDAFRPMTTVPSRHEPPLGRGESPIVVLRILRKPHDVRAVTSVR